MSGDVGEINKFILYNRMGSNSVILLTVFAGRQWVGVLKNLK